MGTLLSTVPRDPLPADTIIAIMRVAPWCAFIRLMLTCKTAYAYACSADWDSLCEQRTLRYVHDNPTSRVRHITHAYCTMWPHSSDPSCKDGIFHGTTTIIDETASHDPWGREPGLVFEIIRGVPTSWKTASGSWVGTFARAIAYSQQQQLVMMVRSRGRVETVPMADFIRCPYLYVMSQNIDDLITVLCRLVTVPHNVLRGIFNRSCL